VAKKPEKQKICFVVGPIGDDDSDDRIHADWLLEEIVLPVFAEHFTEFEIKRADKISDPGRIDAQVITALLDADLVIADLTTLNPNAFYEIGIRHTVQKPIIHMHLEGQRIPFDIASFRSIKFARKWPRDLKFARTLLREQVDATMAEGYEVDNPVTFSRGKVEFDKKATPSEKVLQDQVTELSERLKRFEISDTTLHPTNVYRTNLVNPRLAKNRASGAGHQYVLRFQAVRGTTPQQLNEFGEKFVLWHLDEYKIISQTGDAFRVGFKETPNNLSTLNNMARIINDAKINLEWVFE